VVLGWDVKGMKRAAKLSLVLVAAVLIVGLFFIPVVPIRVGTGCFGFCTSLEPLTVSASASVMYAYFGFGAV
jgi:hypothetical protein